MKKELLEKVQTEAQALEVSRDAIRALKVLALDPHGMEHKDAPAMIASKISVSIATANQVIIELLAKNLLVENGEGRQKLEADLVQLNFSPEDIKAIRTPQDVFVNHGAPHSDASMESLARLFSESVDPIYIALEVTSPSVFRGLKDRARLGRRTIFLMPKKRHVPDQRRTHYDEVVALWIDLLKESEAFVKKNIELRITNSPFKDLYTSALSSGLARFDIFFLDSDTTREGEMLEVKGGTTLYEAIHARYKEALNNSCPLWRIWAGKAAWLWFKRLIVPVLLVGAGYIFALIASGTQSSVSVIYSAISVISLGLFVNIITQYMGLKKWLLSTPFKK